MRYPACEKLEIIQLVEHSHLPVRRTLVKLGIPRANFYRWYDLYRTGGRDALGDRSPGRIASGTRFLTWCASGSSGSRSTRRRLRTLRGCRAAGTPLFLIAMPSDRPELFWICR
jgi:transposase-like protein